MKSVHLHSGAQEAAGLLQEARLAVSWTTTRSVSYTFIKNVIGHFFKVSEDTQKVQSLKV